MKKVILLICFMGCIAAWSQHKSTPITQITEPNNLVVYKNAIFLAGVTMLPHKGESDSACSWLQKYDQHLHLLWSLKLAYSGTSRIDKIEIANDQIYALVMQGTNTRTTFHSCMTLYTISLQGKIISQIKIGDNTFGPATNMVVDKNKLYVAYTKPGRNTFANVDPLTPMVVEYDLATKTLIRKNGNSGDYAIHDLCLHNSRLLTVSIEPKGVLDAIIRVTERATPFPNKADPVSRKTT